MDGYLTYEIDINSEEFLDFLNLSPDDVDSYLSLTSSFDSDINSIRNNISHELSFIDFAVNAYYQYGSLDYLTPTNPQNHLFEIIYFIASHLKNINI